MLLTRSDPPCRRVVCGRDAERLKEAPRGICRGKIDVYAPSSSSPLFAPRTLRLEGDDRAEIAHFEVSFDDGASESSRLRRDQITRSEFNGRI